MSGPGARVPSRNAVRIGWVLQLAFLAAHIPLASLIPRYSSLATMHGLAVLGLGVAAALLWRRPVFAGCAAAYITGAEVFWRMKAARIPWEFAKFAVVLVLLTAMVRTMRLGRATLPGMYFALLLPSVLLTLWTHGIDDARSRLSFNLSGPLALAVCAAFFTGVRFSRREFQMVLVCLIAPILSTAAVGARVLRIAIVEFGTVSNTAASGGFGPNQVSAILGLGMVAIFVYLVLGTDNFVMTAALIGFLLFVLRQCILTFSRGGIYMALGAMAAGAFFLVADSRSRWRLIALGSAIVALSLVFVLPRIEQVTGGAARDRFSSLDTTGRTRLMAADMKTWLENPVLGIGPGLGDKNRLKAFRVGGAHTEWTRLPAEHGLLGLAAGALLVLMAVRHVRGAPTYRGKAIAAAFIAYSFLHLSVDATRLAGPAFAFGLSGVILRERQRQAAQRALPRRETEREAARLRRVTA